jgi:hypothetical protein
VALWFGRLRRQHEAPLSRLTRLEADPMTTQPDATQWCAYHKAPHPADEFSGRNRYCKAGLNEYRRAKRQEHLATHAKKVEDGAMPCEVCKTAVISRPNSRRCASCIRRRRHRCACGRVTAHPVCGICRWKLRCERAEEARRQTLARGVKVVTGDGHCAQCGVRLERLPNGTLAGHACG